MQASELSKLQLKTSPELDKTQALYRIVDFFAAADIIQSQRIRLSRADTFSDKNEGIEILLGQLERSASPLRMQCGGTGWSDLKTARQTHAHLQQSHYVSCWSRKAESVAMWSLYSPDHCGVRIKTSVQALEYVLLDFLNQKSFLNTSLVDNDKYVVFASEAGVYPVSYTSLPNLLEKINRKIKVVERLKARYKNSNRELPGLMEIPRRYYEREKQRILIPNAKTCLIKDSSFEHEYEIRALVRLAETKFDKQILELKEIAEDPTNLKYHDVVDYFHELFDYVKITQLPDFEFAHCSSDFVTAVTIDPRCPSHKRHFMEKWFREKNIPIEDSYCFGYIPDSFSIFPKS
jgi:hypothetical protein